MTAPTHERERAGQELATSTLAEIYAQQGLLERALAIYERIAERSPDDPMIAGRIASLSRAIRERSGPPVPVATDPEPRPEPAVAEGRDEEFESWLANR